MKTLSDQLAPFLKALDHRRKGRRKGVRNRCYSRQKKRCQEPLLQQERLLPGI